MRRNIYFIVAVVAVCASHAIGQDDGEQRIRKALEGRQVLVLVGPAQDQVARRALELLQQLLDVRLFVGVVRGDRDHLERAMTVHAVDVD